MSPDAEFIESACVPLNGSASWQTLEHAEAILAAHPDVGASDIHVAAILGDDLAVCRFLQREPGSVTATRGPRGWDALTHLCFSRYLSLDTSRSTGFVLAAEALLDAGANPNGGFLAPGHDPEPRFESVLYGAAGIAHHAPLTRLLLERGADPNDGETPYHTPEGLDDAALKVLVESGRVDDQGLLTMLVRKHDWHHYEGIKWLLEYGVDPNSTRYRRLPPVHHAVMRDNVLPIFELLLDHGADPTFVAGSHSAIALAARRGRKDLLELFERREFDVALTGAEGLIAACARHEAVRVRSNSAGMSKVRQVVEDGGKLLSEFSGNGNTDGIRLLLELGVDPGARFIEGDGYWDVAPESTAVHAAAWRIRHQTVMFLLAHGAPVDARDARGRTPLMMAVKACVASYWSDQRSTDTIAALLQAGASVSGVTLPSGYAEADALIESRGGGNDA